MIDKRPAVIARCTSVADVAGCGGTICRWRCVAVVTTVVALGRRR